MWAQKTLVYIIVGDQKNYGNKLKIEQKVIIEKIFLRHLLSLY